MDLLPPRLLPVRARAVAAVPTVGATADNPTHRRIIAQAVGVVHVLVATEAAEED
jgi:hypothetical protein